jgi:hypothetical protein
MLFKNEISDALSQNLIQNPAEGYKYNHTTGWIQIKKGLPEIRKTPLLLIKPGPNHTVRPSDPICPSFYRSCTS